jgi:hypothetical protein
MFSAPNFCVAQQGNNPANPGITQKAQPKEKSQKSPLAEFGRWLKERFSANVSHFMIFQEEGVGLKIAANPVGGGFKARLGWEQNIVQLVPKVELRKEPKGHGMGRQEQNNVQSVPKNDPNNPTDPPESYENASAVAASRTKFEQLRPPTVSEFIATGKAAKNLAKSLNGNLPLPETEGN